jgi:hypothetical protein
MCIKKAAFQGNAALDSRMGVSQMCGEKSNGQDLLPVVHRHVYRIQCSANPIELGVIGVMHVKRSLCTMIQQVTSRRGG